MWRTTRQLLCLTQSKNVFDATKRSIQAVPTIFKYGQFQTRGASDDAILSSVFKPVVIKSNSDTINVGAELTGQINKYELLQMLNAMTHNKMVLTLCKENGIDSKFHFIFDHESRSFRPSIFVCLYVRKIN